MPPKKREFDNISELTESEQDKLFQELLQAKRQRTGDLGSSSESEAEMLKGKGAKSRMSTGFPDRGRTAVGPQVEHASAYVLFEELAISAIKSMKRSDAPKAIADAYKTLPLSSAAITEIENETSAEKLKGFYDKDQRRENYEKVKPVLTDDDEFEKYKQAIKRSNHSILSEIYQNINLLIA